MADRLPGNLVKLDPVYGLVLDQVALLEKFIQVPGDRLALTVRVGGQIQGIGLFHCPGYGVDMFPAALDDLVSHLEVLLRIHGIFLAREIPHMAVGGQRDKIVAEIARHGARLGRRFDDN